MLHRRRVDGERRRRRKTAIKRKISKSLMPLPPRGSGAKIRSQASTDADFEALWGAPDARINRPFRPILGRGLSVELSGVLSWDTCNAISTFRILTPQDTHILVRLVLHVRADADPRRRAGQARKVQERVCYEQVRRADD
jgi:hypothetical protein